MRHYMRSSRDNYFYMAFLAVILVLIYLSSSLADEFNCPSLPPLTKSAQNVYELKPQDIKVVMALGDSIMYVLWYVHTNYVSVKYYICNTYVYC